MKFLIANVSFLDRFLSPELRKMEARDLFRVRFLVLAILFAIVFNFALASWYLSWSGDAIGLYGALVNGLVSGALLWQLGRTTEYQRPAAVSILWMHGLYFFLLWAYPGLISLVFLWSSCLIFMGCMFFGMRAALLSTLVLTIVSVLNILTQFYQDAQWVYLNADAYTEHLLVQIVASSLCLGIVTGFYEFMREMNEKLQTRQRILTARHAHTGAVGELVGHVAHEVNNPLAILQGSVMRLRRLLERNAWAHEARKILENMQHSHERIIHVQKSLEVFASGNQHELFVSSNVRDILRDVQSAMRPQAQAQQVPLEFKDQFANRNFRCQHHQLVYVLCSLIQNALDACRAQPNPRIVVDVHDEGQILAIVVTDNGRGIDPAIQDRIFQPFFTTKTSGNARGLSLSVSSGILTEHGGSIVFSSRRGATTFTCQIPCKQPTTVRLRKGA